MELLGINNIIADSLIISVLLLGCGWVMHFIVWRVKIPEAYPLWIPGIFLTTFFCYAFLYFYLSPLAFSQKCLWLSFVVIPYGLMAVAYFMAYAGIIEYSPSVEILLEIRSHMPQGVDINNIKVKTLPEDMLIDLRLKHLVDSGMVHKFKSTYQITPKGIRFKKILIWYRKILFVNFAGQG